MQTLRIPSLKNSSRARGWGGGTQLKPELSHPLVCWEEFQVHENGPLCPWGLLSRTAYLVTVQDASEMLILYMCHDVTARDLNQQFPHMC